MAQGIENARFVKVYCKGYSSALTRVGPDCWRFGFPSTEDAGSIRYTDDRVAELVANSINPAEVVMMEAADAE